MNIILTSIHVALQTQIKTCSHQAQKPPHLWKKQAQPCTIQNNQNLIKYKIFLQNTLILYTEYMLSECELNLPFTGMKTHYIKVKKLEEEVWPQYLWCPASLCFLLLHSGVSIYITFSGMRHPLVTPGALLFKKSLKRNKYVV